MSQLQVTRSRHYKYAQSQVRENAPESIVILIARQMDRAEDAHERIEREGSVVRDPKGSVIAHPAIAIELTATKAIADLMAKYQRNDPWGTK